MNFTQLQAAVYTETNRPDLEDETAQKILASTLKLHSVDFFYKDILEAEVVFQNTAYIQKLDTTVFPRFRNMAVLRRYDPSLQASQLDPSVIPPTEWVNGYPVNSMPFYKFLTPDDILDEFGRERLNVMYQAGTSFNIKSAVPLKYALASWYAYPNLDISNAGAAYYSWIANEFPYAIVYDATSALLQTIGQTDAARKYDDPKVGLTTVALQQLIMANITGQGR